MSVPPFPSAANLKDPSKLTKVSDAELVPSLTVSTPLVEL